MTCELFNDAVRSYKKAVFIDKGNVRAWNMLGYSYKSNGDLGKSTYAYQEALKADPKDKNANFSLGVILVSEKKYKEAVPYFEQIIAFGPDKNGQTIDIVSYHKSSLRLLANCYEALNEFSKRDSLLKEPARRVVLQWRIGCDSLPGLYRYAADPTKPLFNALFDASGRLCPARLLCHCCQKQ